MKIVITGSAGLLGWHAAVRLHAANCAARFRGERAPYEVAALERAAFGDDARLRAALSGSDAVLHFAGINRSDDAALEHGNIALAERLTVHTTGRPVVVYANSTHSGRDIPYGRGKVGAARVLADWAGRAGAHFADLVLPHVFGERGRAHYNNVAGTLCAAAVQGDTPDVNPDGRVELVHAGEVAERAIELAVGCAGGTERIRGREIAVPELWNRIRAMHEAYEANTFPDLSDPFEIRLFNTYRLHRYPDRLPPPPRLHTDTRGWLFEAARGGGGGQSFVSRTEPGVTRGDHFHLAKVERFLVLEGEAVIRIRRALGHDVWEYRVNGREPHPVDMPTLHTHSIENVGTGPLLTMFWTNEIFDPARPDTYADRVLETDREAVVTAC